MMEEEGTKRVERVVSGCQYSANLPPLEVILPPGSLFDYNANGTADDIDDDAHDDYGEDENIPIIGM